LAFLLLGFIQQEHAVAILMYHSVNPVTHKDNRLVVSAYTFERQMRFLKEHRYNVMPLDRIGALIRERKQIPPHAIAITLDDGFKDNYIYAFPILKKYNLSATIFLIVNEIEIPQSHRLSWQEIKIMQDSGLITFGSHTLSHLQLKSFTPEEELKKQIFGSKSLLEERLNRPVNLFSYPFGEFNIKTRQLVINAGYKAALATYIGVDLFSNDLFALKRVPITENDKNLFFSGLRLQDSFIIIFYGR